MTDSADTERFAKIATLMSKRLAADIPPYDPEFAGRVLRAFAGAPTEFLAHAFGVHVVVIRAWRMLFADFREKSVFDPHWLEVLAEKLLTALAPGQESRRKRAGEMHQIAVRRRRKSDPHFRLLSATRSRIGQCLRGGRDGKLLSRLGYSREDLLAHLERQFREGMSWDNYGKWHVDHKRPCASFDTTDPEQFMECWALQNLQPLWASENLKKGASYAST